MKNWLIRKLGGFPSLEDALEGTDKRHILREAVKDLYCAIGPNDVLRVNEKGQWIFEGRPLSPETLLQIQEERKMFLNSKLWAILKQDVRYQLSRKMFEEARLPEDMLWGQLATFLWDVIKTRLEKLK